jgi:hypothetical protein
VDVKLLHGLSVHFYPGMGSKRKASHPDHVNGADSRLVEVPEQRQRPQQAVVRRPSRYEEILGSAKATDMFGSAGRRASSGHRRIALVSGPEAAVREQPSRRHHALKRKETTRFGLSRGLSRRDNGLPVVAGGFEQVLLQAGIHECSVVLQYPILGDAVFPGERKQGRSLVIRRRRDNPEV